MTRSRKPSVFQIGKVRDDGRTVVISGWGLGLCAAALRLPPPPRRPVTSPSPRTSAPASLGLASYRDGGCDCCEPWTADELAAVLRDFQLLAEPRRPGAPRRLSPAARQHAPPTTPSDGLGTSGGGACFADPSRHTPHRASTPAVARGAAAPRGTAVTSGCDAQTLPSAPFLLVDTLPYRRFRRANSGHPHRWPGCARSETGRSDGAARTARRPAPLAGRSRPRRRCRWRSGRAPVAVAPPLRRARPTPRPPRQAQQLARRPGPAAHRASTSRCTRPS